MLEREGARNRGWSSSRTGAGDNDGANNNDARAKPTTAGSGVGKYASVATWSWVRKDTAIAPGARVRKYATITASSGRRHPARA